MLFQLPKFFHQFFLKMHHFLPPNFSLYATLVQGKDIKYCIRRPRNMWKEQQASTLTWQYCKTMVLCYNTWNWIWIAVLVVLSWGWFKVRYSQQFTPSNQIKANFRISAETQATHREGYVVVYFSKAPWSLRTP